MKRSLDYLPRNKQNTIRAIVKLIRDAVEVEMIILFGSFARDDYVEDRGKQFFSDYDVRSVSHKCRRHGAYGRDWEQEWKGKKGGTKNILDNLCFMQVQFLPLGAKVMHGPHLGD